MKEESKKWNISIELLRIISMIMIIILHFFTYSNVIPQSNTISAFNISSTIIHTICNVAVNCYILISGYFCINSKFKASKLYKIISEVFLYSILIYVLMLVTKQISFSFKELIYSFLPTLTRQYWFVTCYVGTYIISPIIRFISEKINKTEHKTILLIGFLLFVLYYNLFFFCDNLNFGGATGIVWFVYLYFWGIYFQKYYQKDYSYKNFINYGILVLLSLASRIPFWIIYFLTKKNIFLQGASIFDSVYNSIFPFLTSIFLFKAFLNLKIKKANLKVVRFLSSSTFAVYILHENPYLRNIIWKTIDFNSLVGESSIKLIIYTFTVSIIIFLIGIIIDKMFKLVVNKIFWNKRILNSIDNVCCKMWNKIQDKMLN